MNEHSSRSHTIFRIVVESRERHKHSKMDDNKENESENNLNSQISRQSGQKRKTTSLGGIKK
jgi:hypothetical protein